ncbi:hypothetical protein CDL12_23591 [Handroanthus impetiginosus]|uniref:SCP domain-containing protein n=1 Tax=Handroanthus impetiginosus TaxID=429701 RepID=A0A2G9GF04_9LAMI|nr:hypothetical protein CDL12_23591 [Handroanthus impetiginosus]
MQKSMLKARIFGVLLVAALTIAAVTADLVHPTPKDRLKKRKPINALPPEPPYAPIFNWEQQEYLKAHNDLRRKVGVPPVVWDANLTAEAHAWAVQRRGDCNYRRHSSNQYGENIYWKSYKEFTPTDVVEYWFDEYKFYDHQKFQCRCQPERAGCECGHYLNIVWSTTKRIGCSGPVYCDNQMGVYVVCEYDPAGLTPGINPFNGLKLEEEVADSSYI